MEERKNINELIALYSLEHEVKDIYVEGERDKHFINWFIDSKGVNNIGVYVIGDINVADEVLDKYELTHGSNRSKIIAAAMEISEELPDCNNVLFIADRDYEDYIPTIVKSNLLSFTDYNSLESYLLNESTLRKILAIVYGDYSEHTPSFYYTIKIILRQVFSIRLANEQLKWGMKWIDFKKYVKVNPLLVFDDKRFIEAYLKKNSKWSRRSEFFKCVDSNDKHLEEDCRLSIRGHDFTTLLLHYFNKKYQKKKLDKIDLFEGFLLSSLDKSNLMEEELLKIVSEFSTVEI